MHLIAPAFLATIGALGLAAPWGQAEVIPPEAVPVAWYSLRPDHTKDGDRILHLLLQNHIRAIAGVSDSVTVTVAARDAQHAHDVIAAAIRDENLRVKLYPKSLPHPKSP